MRTIITIVVTALVTVAAGAAVLVGTRSGRTGGAHATRVSIERPQRGELTEHVHAQAEVQPRTKVAIRSRVSARVAELPVRVGDSVSRGRPEADPPVPPSVLVRLDAADLEAALASAEARRAAQAAQTQVEQARIAAQEASIQGTQAALAQARRDLDRQRALLESRDVSQSAVDSLQSRVDELSAQLAAAEHSLQAARLSLVVLGHQLEAADAEIASARDKLTYTTVTASIDGVVTRLDAEVGELVVPGTMNQPGTVIMEVADLSRMLLVARVAESDVQRVRPGQRAHARIQTVPDDVIEGTVESVSLIHRPGSAGSRYYETEILLEGDGRTVLSGSSADVRIEANVHLDVLKLPGQCVLERRVDALPVQIRENSPEVDRDKTYATVVYRLIDGRAVVTPVRIGPSDETHTVILSGLDETDEVVAGPYKVLESIAHGDRIVDEREAEAQEGPVDAQAPPQG